MLRSFFVIERGRSCFGVPLEESLEKSAVESRLGFGRGILRIPAFVEAAVLELERRGLATPGIFRRSGSQKRINELRDLVSKAVDVKELKLECASFFVFVLVFFYFSLSR